MLSARTSTELKQARQRWVDAKPEKRGGKFLRATMVGASADERELLKQLRKARSIYLAKAHSATGRATAGDDYRWFTVDMLVQLVRRARVGVDVSFDSTLERCYMWGPVKAMSRPLLDVLDIVRDELHQGALLSKVRQSPVGQ